MYMQLFGMISINMSLQLLSRIIRATKISQTRLESLILVPNETLPQEVELQSTETVGH